MAKKSKDVSKAIPKRQKDLVSIAVFVFTITIVSISLVSVVFPALISATMGYSNVLEGIGISQKVDPFEAGPLAVPLFAASITVLWISLLYFKGKMPHVLSESLARLFRFEISKKVAFIVMIIILAGYVSLTAGELSTEEKWLDYEGVKNRLETWDIGQATNLDEPHVRYFLLDMSMTLFGNYGVVPFLASIALLITVYFLTKKITQKRFAGVVAVLIMIQSNVFLTYDTSVTYDNFWILFYLVSLYSVVKAWPVSPVAYLISIPAKALTAMFLPMSMFFIYCAEINKKRKLILLGIYGLIGIIGIVAITSFNASLSGTSIIESGLGFWQGFAAMAIQMRFDVLVVLFLLPLIVGLFIASRNGFKYADSIMVMIGVFLLTAPFLTGFTNMTNQPYRFVPLVAFFAMGVGVLLSKRDTIPQDG